MVGSPEWSLLEESSSQNEQVAKPKHMQLQQKYIGLIDEAEPPSAMIRRSPEERRPKQVAFKSRARKPYRVVL